MFATLYITVCLAGACHLQEIQPEDGAPALTAQTCVLTGQQLAAAWLKDNPEWEWPDHKWSCTAGKRDAA
jgi:hypothetical protein